MNPPHINSSTSAIITLWEASFLLKQRLIVPHSFARLQEVSSTTLGWGFHLFNAILASLGKSTSQCQRQILSNSSNGKLLIEAKSCFLQLLQTQKGPQNNAIEKQKCLQATTDLNDVQENHQQETTGTQSRQVLVLQTQEGPLQPCVPSTKQLQKTHVLLHLKSLRWIPSA